MVTRSVGLFSRINYGVAVMLYPDVYNAQSAKCEESDVCKHERSVKGGSRINEKGGGGGGGGWGGGAKKGVRGKAPGKNFEH